MKNLIWLGVGAALGYGFASVRRGHYLEGGIFDALDEKFREFGRTVRTSYRDRQDELRDAIAGADGDERRSPRRR